MLTPYRYIIYIYIYNIIEPCVMQSLSGSYFRSYIYSTHIIQPTLSGLVTCSIAVVGGYKSGS